MAEPVSAAGTLTAGALAASVAGMLSWVDTSAAVGSLMGALVYMTTTQDIPTPRRLLFFIVSFVMGYMLAPAIVDAEAFGIHPFKYSGPAGFVGAALVVTISLATIEARKRKPEGKSDERE